jgi:hypothetical protein
MSLLGEKCVRCNSKRTRETVDGLPTCEPCQRELHARVEAASEDRRKCLIDGAEMNKDVILNIVIDRCPQCKGVWLDGGELELIRGAVARGTAMDLARAMTYPG